MMEESIPSLDGAFQAQENQTEERGDNPGTHRSPSTEEEPNEGLLLQESFSQISISGREILGTAEIPFLYFECGTGFAQQGDLTLQQRIHPRKKLHKCSVCVKSIDYASNFRKHLIIHPGEKPYKCSVCGSSFARLYNLNLHQRIHTRERPCECIYCGKGFLSGSYLRDHKRIHTGEKPYKCSMCETSFRTSRGLRGHQCIRRSEAI